MRGPGWIYTIHLFERIGPADRGLKNQAQHYTGYTEGDPTAEDKFEAVEPRLQEHREGRGAKLMAEVERRGIDWIVANVEPGDRNRERQLKKHSAARRCAVCQWDQEMQGGPQMKTDQSEILPLIPPVKTKLTCYEMERLGTWLDGTPIEWPQPDFGDDEYELEAG